MTINKFRPLKLSQLQHTVSETPVLLRIPWPSTNADRVLEMRPFVYLILFLSRECYFTSRRSIDEPSLLLFGLAVRLRVGIGLFELSRRQEARNRKSRVMAGFEVVRPKR